MPLPYYVVTHVVKCPRFRLRKAAYLGWAARPLALRCWSRSEIAPLRTSEVEQWCCPTRLSPPQGVTHRRGLGNS
eukprot:g17617.t1